MAFNLPYCFGCQQRHELSYIGVGCIHVCKLPDVYTMIFIIFINILKHELPNYLYIYLKHSDKKIIQSILNR